MHLDIIDHYITLLDFKFRRLYILWISDDIDGVVVDNQRKVIAFKDKAQLLKFVEKKAISLKEGITAYYINNLQQWVLEPDRNIDYEVFLNFWNLCTDISYSVGIDFMGDVRDELINNLYNKLFDASETFISEEPNPTFNEVEISKLSEIIQNGLALLIDNLSVN